MKKIKEFSRSYIFLSFLYVAVGVVLLVWPTLSIQMIGKGVGVIMLVVGATYGVIYFTSDKRQEGYLQLELVIAIICAAFGVFVLLTPDFMRMVLPFAMATVLLVGAIVKIQSAVSMKRLMIRRWYLTLILALIIIALGIFLLVYPFAEDYQMLIYIGICLIADGLTNLTGLLAIRLRTRKLEKIQKKNPGVDVKALIEDEWARSDAAKAEKKARKREMKEQKRKEQEIVVEAEEAPSDGRTAGTSESCESEEYKAETPESQESETGESGRANDALCVSDRHSDSGSVDVSGGESDSGSADLGVQLDMPETGLVTSAKAMLANTFSKRKDADTEETEEAADAADLQENAVSTDKEETLSADDSEEKEDTLS